MRRYLAELIATFTMVFAGTGAIIVNDLAGGSITHLGISLTFGLVVMTMIYSVGNVSGAHLNPAVTLGFWFARRLPGRRVLPYAASQIVGAVAASLLLGFMFTHDTLGATVPVGGVAQSFGLEILISFFLMFVILGVSTGAKEQGVMAGVAVGATVCLCALMAGPVSGGSMNPARSLGPAVAAASFSHLWLYLLAPVVGALLAVLGCRLVREPGCCRSEC